MGEGAPQVRTIQQVPESSAQPAASPSHAVSAGAGYFSTGQNTAEVASNLGYPHVLLIQHALDVGEQSSDVTESQKGVFPASLEASAKELYPLSPGSYSLVRFKKYLFSSQTKLPPAPSTFEHVLG